MRLPSWMAKCPEPVPVVLFALVGVLAVPTGFVSGWARTCWIVAAVLAFLVATAITIARDSRRRAIDTKKDTFIQRAEQEHVEALQHLLGNRLHNLAHVVAEVLATPDPQVRRPAAQSARKTIICAAAEMVGQRTNGTRANLFRLDTNPPPTMTLEPQCFFGRGDRSSRVFKPGDETYDSTMANKSRFVESVSTELAEAEGLQYETFLTHPVSVGPERVHGVITVDSPKVGDLSQEVDVPMMAVLSTLIAMTYEVERYPSPRRLSGP